MSIRSNSAWLALALSALSACGSPDAAPAQATPDTRAQEAVQAYVAQNVEAFLAATTELRDAAPTEPWDETKHATELANMRGAWKKARVAYERVEGAIAVLFPEQDRAVDDRYDAKTESYLKESPAAGFAKGANCNE